MYKISFALFASWVVACCQLGWAQDEVAKASPILPTAKASQTLFDDFARGPGSHKTSERIIDTVLFDSHIRRCDSIWWHSRHSGDGYLSGTSGIQDFTSGGQTVKRVVTEHGLNIKLLARRNRDMRVWGFFVLFTDKSQVINAADDFHVNVYKTNILSSPAQDAAPNYSQKFNIDMFPSPWEPGNKPLYSEHNLILFDEVPDNSKLTGDPVFFTLETKHATSDDTLCFYFKSPNERCDPGDTNTWVIRLKDENYKHVRWQTFGNTYNSSADVPIMAPVVHFSGWPESNEPAIEAGNLQLMGNYPNPAVHSTFIKFGLKRNSQVTFRVVDLQGREVFKAAPEAYPAGVHEIPFSTTALSCGEYIYVLESSNGVLAGRIVVDKQ